ncbi:hypothetical protein ABVK25_003855 [Lepraria finkii]|uniref:Uncharacterized protein n=1 Tax=Lepraria finkii TaxID=1340010 RepID=A0ABR4BI50_9LECA
MTNASDIITFIGIPFGVLGVLPILYLHSNKFPDNNPAHPTHPPPQWAAPSNHAWEFRVRHSRSFTSSLQHNALRP